MESLPNEILLQIFECPSLTNADIAHCQSVCRRLDIIAKRSIRPNYTFKVDYKTHPTWRLIRCLLINPELGAKFTSINVTWHRRHINQPRTWTKQWKWTDQEKDQIQILSEMYQLIPATVKVIVDGINSEALLPLFLAFTTNLRDLDLGDTEPNFIRRGPFTENTIRMLNSCYEDGESPFDDPDNYRFGDHAMIKEKYAFGNPEVLWFHANIDLGNLLPGLKSVGYIRNWYQDLALNEPGWHAMGLAKMLFLPQLHTLKTWCFHAWVLGFGLAITAAERQSGRKKSTVKSLELLQFSFRGDMCFDMIAEMTGSLECLVWSTPTGMWRSKEQIADLFLRHNPDTLKRDRIVIGPVTWKRPGSPNRNDEEYEDA
ncbi:hypothetical protein TWF694_001304 [Orbilia ellipsospora]|uniref:F-box domain-containing protein n=1 Tax=Orbilia ellipsospora TaxID=2528407 RepID=A0AAV9XSP6_9PEZI